MKNGKKRICALLLVLALLLPLLSTAAPPVSAEEPGEETAAAVLPEMKKAKENGKETRRALPLGKTAATPVRGESDIPALSLDTEYEVVINEPDSYVWLSFTPAESGSYVLSSSTDSDTYCELYDADFNFLRSDDDSGSDTNFSLHYQMERDTIYYFLVRYLSSDVGSFPVMLSVYTPVTSGWCGDSLTWEFLEESGLLTITGSGEMYSWYWDQYIPWFDFTDQITSIQLPNDLSSIGDYAFANCWRVSSLQIPDNVRTIGSMAFFGCLGLQKFTIPANVSTLGYAPFASCTNMTAIQVDAANPCYSVLDGVLFNDDQSALIECPAGKTGSYTVPDSVSWIMKDAFYGCQKLTAVSIPDGVTDIDPEAFFDCSRLEQIDLPDGLEVIWSNTFYNCCSLAEIELPQSLTSIQELAFGACSRLTEIVIPQNVTWIGYNAFAACSMLQYVTILGRNCSAEYEPGTLGEPEYTTIRGAAESAVREYADYYGYNYEEINLCDYGSHIYELLDQMAHTDAEPGWRLWRCADCGEESLETTPAGHVFSCVDNSSWICVMQCDYCDLQYEDDCSFDIVSGDEFSVQIEQEFGAEWARFTPEKTGFYEIVSRGGADAYCELYAQDGTSIDYNDDGGEGGNFCLRVSLTGGETYYFRLSCFGSGTGSYFVRLVSIEVAVSGQCGPTLYWEMDLETNTLVIEGSGEMDDFGGPDSFDVSELPWGFFYADISDVSLPEGLTSIGNNAFFAFSNLFEIELPAGLERIGHDAFSCSELTGIVIPDSVTEIGQSAFSYCDSLRSIRFPAGLETLEGFICYACGSLSEIQWPAALTEIGVSAFAYCSMERVEFPNSLTVIGRHAFMYNQALNKIVLPGSLLEIQYDAFLCCPNLIEVTIPGSVVSIDNFALGYLSDGSVGAARGDIEGEIRKVEGFTIRGVSGSEAERYAIDNEFIFLPLVEFSDVTPGSWYYNAVQWAVENGITSGTGDGKFSPKKTCTREQVMAFLWKAEGSPLPETDVSPFTDVVSGKYYYKPVLWAVENMITGGVSNTLFGVGRGCTREQVMTFIWKALGSPQPVAADNPFTDVIAGKYYYKPVLWAVENGITSGTGEGVFGVGKTCTRAQIVTFLYNALVKWQPSDSDEYVRAADETVYDQNLGEFAWRMEQVKDAQNNDERFVALAQAEAALLDSAAVIPAYASGGGAAISREAPHTRPYVHWGSDGERLHSLVISQNFLTRIERAGLDALWEKAVAENGVYDPAAWLKARGHELLHSYTGSYTTEPETLDWLATARSSDFTVLVNCVDGLVEYDNVGRLQPALADSWELSEDGLCYTFHIRDDVWWYTADGVPYAKLTARDFEAGFRHMLDASSGMEGLVGEGVAEITGVEGYLWGGASFDSVGCKALDEHSLRFTLNKPVPFFMSMLGSTVFLPMCESFYLSRGGVFGVEAFQEALNGESYSFGQIDDIYSQVYCGPFLPQTVDLWTEVVLVKNEGCYRADEVTLDTVRWICTMDMSPEEIYADALSGVFTGVEIYAGNGILELAENDGRFEQFGYFVEPSNTTFMGLLNLNRGKFIMENGNCASGKSEREKIDTFTALNNKNFRKALMHAFDKTAFNAVSRGWELATNNLRNTITHPQYVRLENEVTDENGHTFPAGSFYGELLQHYCDELGCQVVCQDGVDGWYNPEAAADYLAQAVAELGKNVEWPIQIDVVYYGNSDVQTGQAWAYKNSIEGVLGSEYVCVNLIESQDMWEYFDSTSNVDRGADCNYDMFYGSGWGPDYTDPASYLNAFDITADGYMLRFLGLF